MLDFAFVHYRNKRITSTPLGLELDGQPLPLDEMIDFGAPVGAVAVRDLARAAAAHTRLTGVCHAQLAALAYGAGAPRALHWYFPLAGALEPDELDEFDLLIAELVRHQSLDVRLIGEGGADITAELPVDSRSIIAGHLAE